uniref:Glycosyltransferase 2-like domain-containing protein n=1 Tax=uncultured Desulfobacterium sp. TaxID=201089 RepID=E1YA63_9BACT|nr:hypothetical protein N47_H22790 [uncultured Desulfobacterium sp.]
MVKIVARAFLKFGPRSLWNVICEYLFGIDQITNSVNSGFTSSSHINDKRSLEYLRHGISVDIVICVHNAIDDIRSCLSSIIEFTEQPYKIILIDDGSEESTASFLREFSVAHEALLIRNDKAKKYTHAANQGLTNSKGDYVVLINSDTIVTEGWLEHLIMCAESDSSIGIVSPLSNTASWQSIPNYESNGDWAENLLPKDITINDMGKLVVRYSGNIYPRMPFLNGFCLLIRRVVINQIGYFDKDSFPYGYGEENDYCLRARNKGWTLALADNTYIFHAQSKSYGHNIRQKLSKSSTDTLIRLHGKSTITEGIAYCRENLVLNGIRARSKYYCDRNNIIQEGSCSFSGLRILFLLPINTITGGANIIFREAQALQAMGVEVTIANLRKNRESFQLYYGGSNIPIIYLSSLREVNELGNRYDAIIATTNFSVSSLKEIINKRPVLGYYVQDFEPYFYKKGTPEYKIALQSYTLIDRIVLFTKTPWNRNKIMEEIGRDSFIVGTSFDVDLFMPRPRLKSDAKIQPIKICAMVRPYSKHRGPQLTLEVLRNISRRFTNKTVKFIIFGVKDSDTKFKELPQDFIFENKGILNPKEMAFLLNDCDIFTDFSEYQAMGLTAMEAMACGNAAIVPKTGGAQTFAKDLQNALVINTCSHKECEQAIERLLIDHRLRRRLQKNAIESIYQFYPELSAFKILKALFPSKSVKQYEL